jgi:hypothetical protein
MTKIPPKNTTPPPPPKKIQKWPHFFRPKKHKKDPKHYKSTLIMKIKAKLSFLGSFCIFFRGKTVGNFCIFWGGGGLYFLGEKSGGILVLFSAFLILSFEYR